MVVFEAQARDMTGALVMVNEYRGLSTDSKPTDCSVGSTFLEIDTGKVYMFGGTTWEEQANVILSISH